MTRETKIGLLVGLAFIVVFAMLLSHTGPAAAPGDGIQIVKPLNESPALALNDHGSELRGPLAPEEDTFAQASPQPVDVSRPEAVTPLVELPRPEVLESSGGTPPAVVTDPPATGMELLPPTHEGVASMLEGHRSAEFTRVAPPLPEPVTVPQQTPRATVPTVTTPVDQEENVVVLAAPQAPELPTPSGVESREYTVRKGQTLVQIAKDVYGTAATPVIDYLVKSNKDRIKNRHFVVEGQKILTPTLPSDLFEPVTSLNVARATDRVASLNELINSGPTTRQAPMVREPGRRSESESKVRERFYEVKLNQTFSSIAREELGSEARWREIQKLNKNLDPSRLKPGTKIKLPSRRRLSSTTGTSRDAA